MADEHRRHPALLRDPEEPRRRLPHLCDRARRGSELAGVKGLHGVDHADGWPVALEGRADGLELGLREDGHVVGAAEPVRPQTDLGDRFLAGNEQCGSAGAGDRAERREQQRRLANTWLAADEDERRGNETAAEDTVELGHSRL